MAVVVGVVEWNWAAKFLASQCPASVFKTLITASPKQQL
jgi:hypothetical protein